MSEILKSLGVRPIINANGPVTRLSGGLMPPEVAAAMVEVSAFCVDIADLQAAAGRVIAAVTGAEAGLVTSGAAAGLLLGTAACVARLDPGRMARLPDTTGMKDEVIVPRSHRNFYDHAVRAAGVRLVEVGIPDRFSGAGVRDCEAWEIAAAIGPRTAAVLYVASAWSLPDLREVTDVAHAAGVPVIVDAAAQLPPASNLRRFVAEGADLVVFSGGKAMRGPQSSGILCGRRDLIASAALQLFDLDVHPALWDPPPGLIDRAALPGAPQTGIGRVCKVGKEEIVGLVAALERFVAEDPAVRHRAWRGLMDRLAGGLDGLRGCRVDLRDDHGADGVPMVDLTLDRRAGAPSGIDLVRLLRAGDPRIEVNHGRIGDDVLRFGPVCLKEDEPEQIARRLRDLLGSN